MKRSYGYHSYHGRGRGRAARITLIIIAVLLLLLILTFLFLSRYLVYTDNGVRLDLPFFEEQEPQTPADPGLVVESPEPSDDVAEPFKAYRALLLPIAALTDGTAEESLAAAGANVAVFDMKTDEGMLGYVSAQQDAVNAEASQSDPVLNAAITTGNGRDNLYTVARISCFRDLQVSSNRLSCSILSTNGYRWRDPDRIRWLSPMSTGAVDYVLGVIDELCKLGFDEILLDHCAFPTGEGIDTIAPGENYPADPAEREQAVRAFLEQAKAVVAPYGVKLSIRTTGAALSGGEAETSGLTPSILLDNADGLWVDETEIAAGIAYVSDGDRSGAEERLVPVWTGDTAPDPEANWAILDEKKNG